MVDAKSARVTSWEVGEAGNQLLHGFGMSTNINLPTFAKRRKPDNLDLSNTEERYTA